MSENEDQDADEIDRKDKNSKENKIEAKKKKKAKELDIDCVYCWSKKTLTDICVKSMKSFGFIPKAGHVKIPISTLSKEKVRKL